MSRRLNLHCVIFSGAMAERTKLEAYIVFSFFNTLVFCFPAHWVWSDRGFLRVGFKEFCFPQKKSQQQRKSHGIGRKCHIILKRFKLTDVLCHWIFISVFVSPNVNIEVTDALGTFLAQKQETLQCSLFATRSEPQIGVVFCSSPRQDHMVLTRFISSNAKLLVAETQQNTD